MSNLFKCIRDDPDRLARMVALTPYSRYEYEHTLDSNHNDEYEKAIDFLIRCWQGHGFRTTGEKVGWKSDIRGREAMYSLRSWVNLPEQIEITAERLRSVQIENRPALDVIRRFNFANVFMYIDPPYLRDTRRCNRKQYKHEMTREDHIELLEELVMSRAKIIISGYESELYNEILKGWKKTYFDSNDNTGRRVTEVIWKNYDIWE